MTRTGPGPLMMKKAGSNSIFGPIHAKNAFWLIETEIFNPLHPREGHHSAVSVQSLWSHSACVRTKPNDIYILGPGQVSIMYFCIGSFYPIIIHKLVITLSPEASQSTIISISTNKFKGSRLSEQEFSLIFVAYFCNWGGNYTPSPQPGVRQRRCGPVPGPECGKEMQRY